MIFEGPMIIIAVTALTIMHPGRVFSGLWKTVGAGKKSYSKKGAVILDNESHEELAQRAGKGESQSEDHPAF